ncbi:unnamed protein product [Amoebophrya sp. A25]|nr:unnamed protein product [Amoebophrya sp. A25]|eukprot:GSA25T00017576001.1
MPHLSALISSLCCRLTSAEDKGQRKTACQQSGFRRDPLSRWRMLFSQLAFYLAGTGTIVAALAKPDLHAQPISQQTNDSSSKLPPDVDPQNAKFREKYEYCQSWTQAMDQALSLKILSLEKEVYEVRKLLRDFAAIEDQKNREYMQTLTTHSSSIESVRAGIFERLENERMPVALEQKLAELTPRQYCPEGTYLMRLGGDAFVYCASADWRWDVSIKNYGMDALDCGHSERLPQSFSTFVYIESAHYSVAQCVLHAILVRGHALKIRTLNPAVFQNLETQVAFNNAVQSQKQGHQQSEPSGLLSSLAVISEPRTLLASAGDVNVARTAGQAQSAKNQDAAGTPVSYGYLNCTRSDSAHADSILGEEDDAAPLIAAGKHKEAITRFVWNPSQFIQPKVYVETRRRLVAEQRDSQNQLKVQTGQEGVSGESAAGQDPKEEPELSSAPFLYLLPRLIYLQNVGRELALEFFPTACAEVFLDSCDPRPRAALGYVRRIRLASKETFFRNLIPSATSSNNASTTQGTSDLETHLELVSPETSIPFPESPDFELVGDERESEDTALLFAVHGIGYTIFPTWDLFRATVIDPWRSVDFVAWCERRSP